jgi:adenosylmethionine-8-amino-7-oxononanoate aminotransferase
MKKNDLISRDLKHLWHPCSQMKDYEDFPPLEILSAEGSLLNTVNGDVVDIISSWWCKSLGHRHPRIQESVIAQMGKFEHVILANTTNELIVGLCEKILEFCPEYDRVFFCDSGSDAVEVAMKMSLQCHRQTGAAERTQFLSLENGYHGETILTLATGDCGLYGAPFVSLMPEVKKITGIPYVDSINDWPGEDICEESWSSIEDFLSENKKTLSGIVVEPVLQGAGGMKFYSPQFLLRLYGWCVDNGVHLIADEILTGMGRLGYARACEIAGVVPHFSVFSKGLTAGFSPLACVLTSDEIYEAFYDDYETGKAFMHSNTYCGSAIGAAAAVAALETYKQENIFQRVRRDSSFLIQCIQEISDATGCLKNVRGVGFVAAADIVVEGAKSKRLGYAVYREAVKRGVLLRPLGNTLYFLPPLNIPEELLERSVGVAIDSLKAVIH